MLLLNNNTVIFDNRTNLDQAVDCNDFDKMIFNICNVPGDGNCFFLCLSFALNDNFTMSNTYRQTICEYILKTGNIFATIVNFKSRHLCIIFRV